MKLYDPVSPFNVQGNSEYMENHRAVEPLTPQSKMSAALSKTGHAILFIIDETGTLQVAASKDGAKTTWLLHDLSGSDKEDDEQLIAEGIAISQREGGTGNIDLLISVKRDSKSNTSLEDASTRSELWWLSDLENTADAKWLTCASKRKWKTIEYPKKSPVPGINADTLDITDLRMIQWGTALDPAVGLVHAKGQDGVLQPFKIDLSGDGAWEEVITEHSYTAIKDAAVGGLSFIDDTGFFKLYEYHGTTYLSFNAGTGNATFYDVSNKTTAIATLPTVSQGNVVTDLFVADGNKINLYKYDQKGNEAPINITGPDWIESYKFLVVTLDGANSQFISLWGVGDCGKAFHIQALYQDRYKPKAWSKPVPVLTGLKSVAAVMSDKRKLTSLIAVQKTNSVETVIEFHKDHITGSGNNHWHKKQIHLPSEKKVKTLKTYSHSVKFNDANGVALSSEEVLVTSPTASVVEINNQMITINSDGIIVNTDSDGHLEILQEANSPAMPALTFSLHRDASVKLEIDPKIPVRKSMIAGIIDPNSKNGVAKQSWYDSSNIDQVQEAVKQISAIPTKEGATQSDLGLFSYFGDLCHAAFEATEDFVSFASKVVDGVVHVAIKIGDFVFNSIMHTVSDIVNGIAAIVKTIGGAIEEVFKWLAFLFDLQAFKTLTIRISELFDTLIELPGKQGSTITKKLASQITSFGKQIEDDPSSILKNLSAGGFQHFSQMGHKGISTHPHANDARLTWGQSQIPKNVSSDQILASFPTFKTIEDGGVEADLKQVGEDFGKLAVSFGEAIINLSAGSDIKDTLSPTISSLGKLVADSGTLVGDIGADFEVLSSEIKKMLSTDVPVPFFYAILKEGLEIEPSIKNTLSLLTAVPLGVVYLIKTDGDKGDATHALPEATLELMKKTLGTFDCETGAFKALATELASDENALTTAYVFLGVLRVARAASSFFYMTAVLAFEKEARSEPQLEALLLFSKFDTAVWALEGGADVLIDLLKDEKPTLSTINFLCGAFFAGLSFLAVSVKSSGARAEIKALTQSMAFTSICVGIAEILVGKIEMNTDDEAAGKIAGGALILYGTNELLELATTVFSEDEQYDAATKVGLVREGFMLSAAIGYIFAGIDAD